MEETISNFHVTVNECCLQNVTPLEKISLERKDMSVAEEEITENPLGLHIRKTVAIKTILNEERVIPKNSLPSNPCGVGVESGSMEVDPSSQESAMDISSQESLSKSNSFHPQTVISLSESCENVLSCNHEETAPRKNTASKHGSLLADREKDIKIREAVLTDRENAVEEYEAAFVDSKRDVEEREVILINREKAVKTCEAVLEDQERAIKEWEIALASREKAVTICELALEERERAVEVREAALVIREKAVKACEAALADRERAVKNFASVCDKRCATNLLSDENDCSETKRLRGEGRRGD
ncbi:hypothetical protein TNCT_54321 [Trichonephila clavata]|uniref:Uncharacterized protein n=1 Tax=Trichonephila clavata TaxID=2740835 RepID=A0A8X6G8N3_TRICU|nr:hypothetical protein TNCT_54321 [Trichonephila clavata]